jgi:hypothetical protein
MEPESFDGVDMAISLLSNDFYKKLRHTILGTEEEASKFHQMVINIVLANDICDKRPKELRNQRWENAFSNEACVHETQNKKARNRKASILLEHLIQASDVSHKILHWHL